MSEKQEFEFAKTFSEKAEKNARIESILLVIFGPKPSGGGGRVGRWHAMRSLARYLLDAPGHERALYEVKYNWSAKEGLTPNKAEELVEHLTSMTGSRGEVVCENITLENIKFVKWVYGMETKSGG